MQRLKSVALADAIFLLGCGSNVPEGVMARHIDHKHLLYLNITGQPKVIYNKDHNADIIIAPYKPEFIEVRMK
jgi:beta-galactosidase